MRLSAIFDAAAEGVRRMMMMMVVVVVVVAVNERTQSTFGDIIKLGSAAALLNADFQRKKEKEDQEDQRRFLKKNERSVKDSRQ